MNTHETTSEAYQKILETVLLKPDFKSAPRGQEISEVLNYQFNILKPTSDPIVTKDQERNKVIEDYYRKEADLYDSLSNSVEDFSKASKFWAQLANPDGTLNSAYGKLIWSDKTYGSVYTTEWLTPWQWVIDSLMKDRDSRQAILKFNRHSDFWFGNKDVVCTMHSTFHIRDMKLFMTTVMRSQDVHFGLPYDLPWFCGLMDKVIIELKDQYPDLTKGTYTHFVHSLHAYARNYDALYRCAGITPLGFGNYVISTLGK